MDGTQPTCASRDLLTLFFSSNFTLNPNHTSSFWREATITYISFHRIPMEGRETSSTRETSAGITLSFGGSLTSPVGSFGSRRSLWAHLARGVVGNNPCALFPVHLVERRIDFLNTVPRLLRGNCENSPSPAFPSSLQRRTRISHAIRFWQCMCMCMNLLHDAR
jgi:hypothetical protein